MFLSRMRSKRLAPIVAQTFGGRIEKCQTSFGVLTTCHYCAKFVYENMRCEAYLFCPYVEIWIQNYRYEKDIYLAINASNPTLGLTLPLEGAFQACNMPAFSNAGYDVDGGRLFCRRYEQELQALRLSSAEFLLASDGQIVIRSKTCDVGLIKQRLDGIVTMAKRWV